MGLSAETRPMTPEQYLALESASATKHEYVRGAIFAMSGTTKPHNDIAGNVYTLLRRHLRGGPCRTYFEAVKVRVDAADAYFYPDVFVTCDPRDRDDPLVTRHPVLIVEVLSESTADYDRDEKFADYRQLDSLREYVLVDSRIRHVVVYRKNDAGTWEFHPALADESVTLASVDFTLAAAAIYEDTDVPATRARPEPER